VARDRKDDQRGVNGSRSEIIAIESSANDLKFAPNPRVLDEV